MSKKVLSRVLGLTVVMGSFNVVFAADAVSVSGTSNWTPETTAKPAAGLELALSEKGTWIICLEDDLKVEKEIVVDGNIYFARFFCDT